MEDGNNKHLIKSLQSNILFVTAAELIIYNGGLVIKYAVQHIFNLFEPLVGKEYEIYFNANFWIIIPIIITLLILITLHILKRKGVHCNSEKL